MTIASNLSFLEPIVEHGKWTDTVIDAMRGFIRENLSTSKVAKKLSKMTGENFTRNAVIGKARRLNIPLGSIGIEPKTKKQKPVPKRVVTLKPKVFPVLTIVRATPLRLSILEIEQGQCYWPVDILETPAHFCGHPTGKGESWCPAHKQIGYIPPHQRSPRAYR